MTRLYIVAGEASGDTHGAGLIRALHAIRPDLEISGLGGARMAALGAGKIEDWAETAGVVGLWEVLKMYGYFKKKLELTCEAILQQRPEGVVLVDYPGFNLRLAQRLRDGGYQGRLIYYISPQVWAWKKGRVKVMARLLDLMICIFPFEKELYENSGLPTVFAGHPLVDRVAEERGQIARESDLVAFFPGSRANEVRRLLPTLLEAAQLLRQRVPGLRVALSAVSERRAEEMRELVRAAGVAEAVEWIEVGTAGELMQRASVGAVASGTATLEAACFGLPHALVYRVARPTYWVGKLVVRIRFLGILNILAGRQVVTELVQADFTPERVAEVLERLLRDEAARHEAQEAMQRTVAQLGAGGAYPNAAAAVLATLDAADPAVDLGKSSASMRK